MNKSADLGAEVKNEQEDNKKSPILYEVVSIICTAILVIMVLFTFFFRFVGVIGDSMVPTLHENDWLLIHTIDTKYEQGDIIVSSQPNVFNEPIVKRVIATGGQTVDINFLTGEVKVDGVVLKEDYIADLTTNEMDVKFPITVPEGQLFVLGDNRLHSTDSRSTIIGMLDERYIVGKVKFKIFPISDFSYFK